MTDLTLHSRTCQICEACCGLVVSTDSDSRVVSIKGDPNDPISRGYVCPKSQALDGVDRDPDRIRQPMLLVGSEHVPISWDDAFNLAADRLRYIRDDHGADSVGFYVGNPTANNPGLGTFSAMLMGTMNTRQLYRASSVDAHPRLLANALMYGDKAVNALPDIDRCDFFLVIGANPVISNGSMLTLPGIANRLKALRARGGRLVVVDPRRTETADAADQHIAIKPSSDALLLLALINVLFDENLVDPGAAASILRDGDLDELAKLVHVYVPESVHSDTGVDSSIIRELARDLAAAPRAAVYGRVGACCQIFGSITCWLIDVINILTGNVDRAGGVVFSRPIPSNAMLRDPYVGDQAPYDRYRSRVRHFPEFARQFPVFVLAEEIETPGPGQIRAMVTLSGNPALSLPDGARLERAFASLDFMVSVDSYLNETTRLADLILPPISALSRPSFTQHFTTYMVNSYARYGPPVRPHPADGYDDWEIMVELASRVQKADRKTMLHTFMLQLVARVMQGTNTGGARTPDEVLDLLTGDTPPEQIFDLLVRSGDFGDHFGDRAGGVTLALLKRHPSGINFGPVSGGRLPDLLRTPDQRIHLTPKEIVSDLARLDAFRKEGGLNDPGPDEYILSSRRDRRSMNSWLHNVHAFAKGPDRCTLLMHPDDALRLRLSDGEAARIFNDTGSIIVRVAISTRVRPGGVNLPHGYGHYLPGSKLDLAYEQPGDNVNLLLGEAIDEPSGNVAFNRVLVRIEAADGLDHRPEE